MNHLPRSALTYFHDYAIQHRHLIDEEDTFVEFVVTFVERAKLANSDRVYTDPYLLCQLVSGAQGACFLHPEDVNEITPSFDRAVGIHALDAVAQVPIQLGVAVLDAVYSHLNKEEKLLPDSTVEFNGRGAEKSIQRAKALIDIAEVHSGSRVVMIGVISDLVKATLERGCEVRLSDMALSGEVESGILISENAMADIDWSDTLIMTGNTLKTETTSQLLKSASNLGKKVLVYAMTGANIAPRYNGFGASIVTTEHFPYYWYAHIQSQMRIYRA